MQGLEEQLLGEKPIEDDPRTKTPPRQHRSLSPSSDIDTDDELGSDLCQPSLPSLEPSFKPPPGRGAEGTKRVSGGGASRTGVKGVLKDAEHKKALDREMHNLKVRETNAYLESKSHQAQTIEEEDAARKLAESTKVTEDEDNTDLARWRKRRQAELMVGHHQGGDDGESSSPSRFGLREIGASGFVSAVERPGWVIVMLYEPNISRCSSLLQALLRVQLYLSTSISPIPNPPLLLKAHASSLSFSLLPTNSSHDYDSRPSNVDDDDEEEEDGPRRQSDPDVLPTILAYKDGELEHTWIRVDWDVGEDGLGLEGLLRKNGILPKYTNQDIDEVNEDEYE